MNSNYFIFLNIIGFIFVYLSKKYYVSMETISGIIKGLYYIYYLNDKEVNENLIKQNLKIGCESILDLCHINLKINGFKIIDQPILYISNHSSWIDSVILKYLLLDAKTIAKSDTNEEIAATGGDKSFFMKKMSNVIDSILKSWGVIYYKRGSKKGSKGGAAVREKIKEHIKVNNGSILLYPEGTSYPIGGPRSFYPGSFETAFENDILIQPITIKYETDITWGVDSEYAKKYHIDTMRNIHQCQKNKINNVNVTFHPIINPKKFKDHLNMKKYCEIVITDEWINQHNYKNSSTIN